MEQIFFGPRFKYLKVNTAETPVETLLSEAMFLSNSKVNKNTKLTPLQIGRSATRVSNEENSSNSKKVENEPKECPRQKNFLSTSEVMGSHTEKQFLPWKSEDILFRPHPPPLKLKTSRIKKFSIKILILTHMNHPKFKRKGVHLTTLAQHLGYKRRNAASCIGTFY